MMQRGWQHCWHTAMQLICEKSLTHRWKFSFIIQWELDWVGFFRVSEFWLLKNFFSNLLFRRCYSSLILVDFSIFKFLKSFLQYHNKIFFCFEKPDCKYCCFEIPSWRLAFHRFFFKLLGKDELLKGFFKLRKHITL